MSSPVRDAVVLSWSAPATSERRALEIAAFLGVEATSVTLPSTASADSSSIRALVPRCTCLIVSAETLSKIADGIRAGTGGLSELLVDVAQNFFVYGFQPTDRHSQVLRALSAGGLLGVRPHPDPPTDNDAKFQVADGCRKWSGQFSGLSFGAVDSTREHHFLEGGGAAQRDSIVRAGNQPFFVRTEHSGTQWFLVACADLADLSEKVGRQACALSWFSRLVPLMMFLRGALGNRVWHNDTPRACFIIDDPLLRSPRYGFLDYRGLIESMRQRKFSTSIAFIPWNYRRSSSAVATLFSSKNGAPSLCVHGCDHTAGEFATTDVETLRTKSQTALERMKTHRQLSGIPFDDVMVFPQGLFSAEAMLALKASGYLAAVNSDLFSSAQPETLVLRDLLDVAMTRFADFPLFGRRYPRDLAEFAFDLFLGKPALAVEHHGYFRNGYAALESFVERLNGLDERLEWTDLGTICSRACLTRTTESGDVHVRFYTNRFSLTNSGTRAQQYVLIHRHTVNGPLPAPTVNGNECIGTLGNNDLKIQLALEAGKTADIQVSSGAADAIAPKWRNAAMHDVKVLVRRHLSEFRDNYVDTNRTLSAIVATIRNVRRDGKLQAAPVGCL